jgi:hypothetical protein
MLKLSNIAMKRSVIIMAFHKGVEEGKELTSKISK